MDEVGDLSGDIVVYEEIFEDGSRIYVPYPDYEGLPHRSPKPANFVCHKYLKHLGYSKDLWLHLFKFDQKIYGMTPAKSICHYNRVDYIYHISDILYSWFLCPGLYRVFHPKTVTKSTETIFWDQIIAA